MADFFARSAGDPSEFLSAGVTADANGSQNYAGIKNPVVDELIEKIIEASDRKKLVAAVNALDRVLLWEYYVVPHWYVPATRLVFWDKFGMPDVSVMKGVQMMTWWVDAEKEKTLQGLRNEKKARAQSAEKTVFQQLREWF